MRRAAAVVLGTVAGTSLLVGAKLGTSGTQMAADDTGSSPVVVGGPGVTVSGPSGKASGAATGKGTPKPAGTPTTPGPGKTSGSPKPTGRSTGTGKPTSQPTQTPTPTPSGPADGTYSASAQVKGGEYGKLSMSVTISGHRITAISASESNPTEPNCYHSKCPTLINEALAAQSANINSVSGATYTSSAFRSTLQAILNQANA